MQKRIIREKKTIGVMIQMYCNHTHHQSKSLCDDCNELMQFANTRIDRCVFHENKPVCSECSVHCYRVDMRERIKTVMRYAGPQMIFRHPIMGIWHIIDKHRIKAIHPKSKRA